MMQGTYQLPEPLLQAMVSLLGEMPAHKSRGVLNAVELEVMRQDQERTAEQLEQQRQALRAEIVAEGKTRKG